MGGTGSKQGYGLDHIQDNSPAKAAGLIEHVDYIIAVNDTCDLGAMMYIMSTNAGKEVKLLIFNENTKATREVKLTLKRESNDPLGAELEFESLEGGHGIPMALDPTPTPTDMVISFTGEDD